jgi:MoaA/NifB/PqqE/SkfB family radical SAM enzyme
VSDGNVIRLLSLRTKPEYDSCAGTQTISSRAPEPRPLWLWIDTAATCNLDCKLCYTTSMRSKALMSLSLFSTIVERIRRSSARVVKFHLNWRGEPSANPRLPEMLSILGPLGWDVEWHTNGTLITREKADRIVALNTPHTIFFSLDGGDRQSFERNRGVGTWTKSLAGAEAMLAARGDGEWPKLGIYQLDLGVPRARYDPRFTRLISRADRYILMPPVDLDGESLVHSGPHGRVPGGPCFWLGYALAIDHSGRVYTCLLRNGTELGSILEEEVDTLLGRAAGLRDLVEVDGRRSIDGCSRCRKQEGAPHVLA